MQIEHINRASSKACFLFSLVAFLAVLTGFFQAPQRDEGTAAHIFQLSVGMFALTIFAFLATADWKQPMRSIRALWFPIALLALSFGALFYLENFFYAS